MVVDAEKSSLFEIINQEGGKALDGGARHYGYDDGRREKRVAEALVLGSIKVMRGVIQKENRRGFLIVRETS